jgi:hypothetical protein
LHGIQVLDQPLDGAASSLAEMKVAAQDALQKSRVPTTRDEEYRFTDLAKLLGSKICMPAAVTTPAVKVSTHQPTKPIAFHCKRW